MSEKYASDAGMNVDIVEQISALQQRLCELNQQLATERAPDELPDQEVGLLLGRLANEPVALLLDAVQEVFPRARLAPLPASPSWVAGLLNLRGEMIPVVDALARTQSEPRDPVVTDFIVVCRIRSRRVGLVLQGITDVITAAPGELLPTPTDVPFAPYVIGVLKRSAHPVLLLSASVLTAGCDTTKDPR